MLLRHEDLFHPVVGEPYASRNFQIKSKLNIKQSDIRLVAFKASWIPDI